MSINLNRFAGQELYVLLFDQPYAILWMLFCKGLIVLFTEPCPYILFCWIRISQCSGIVPSLLCI